MNCAVRTVRRRLSTVRTFWTAYVDKAWQEPPNCD